MRRLCILIATIAVAVSCVGNQDPDYYVAAYIWPSCHDDPLGREILWPDGEGEWEVIKKGNPRFEGHYQPRQPYWGYEHDNDPVVVEKWINTALEYGVNTFVYDWYWFDGKPFLESAINDGFLKAPNNEKMNFYIMWANHDVKRNYWNYHRYGDDTSLLWDGAVDRKNFEIIVDRVISQYFTRPNYLKIDGCPIFSIFSVGNFIEGLGGVAQAADALEYFRHKAKEAGFEGVHFQYMTGGPSDPSARSLNNLENEIRDLGMDSFAFYNMGGFDVDYLRHCANADRIRDKYDEALDVPVFPGVSIGWDDTPRFPAKGEKHVTRFHNTPESFAMALRRAKEYADEHPEQFPLITINAWNEWVEGSYLLPDMLNGFGYLEAVREVMSEPKN